MDQHYIWYGRGQALLVILLLHVAIQLSPGNLEQQRIADSVCREQSDFCLRGSGYDFVVWLNTRVGVSLRDAVCAKLCRSLCRDRWRRISEYETRLRANRQHAGKKKASRAQMLTAMPME